MKTIRAVLLDVLLVVMITFLIALMGAIFKLCTLVDTTTETMRSVQQLAQQSQVRLVGTSQNLNAALIQVGLAADNVRRASENQDVATKKTLQILDNTSAVLVQANTTLQHIDGESAETLESLRKSLDASGAAIQHADKVISDPTIPQTLAAVNVSATNIASATKSVATSAETINKKVEQLAKPVSLTKQILGKILGIAASAKTLFFK